MFPLVRLTTNCSTALTGKTSRRTPPTSSTRPFNPLRMTPTSNATWTLDRTSPIPTSAAIWPPHPRSRLSPRRLPLPAFQSIPASHSSETASALHKCAGPHSGGSPPCKSVAAASNTAGPSHGSSPQPAAAALPLSPRRCPSPCRTGCSRRPHSGYRRRPTPRSEEHTSELQSRLHLVCRLLLEKKKEET